MGCQGATVDILSVTWAHVIVSSYQGIAGASVVMSTSAKPRPGDDHAIQADPP